MIDLEEEMRAAVSDFRKAAYEFAQSHHPEDHKSMMDAQVRIFALYRAAAAPQVVADERRVIDCAKCEGYGATHYPDGEWEGKCGACLGTGWVSRDADIGTEQECFSCDGSGKIDDAAPVQAQELSDATIINAANKYGISPHAAMPFVRELIAAQSTTQEIRAVANPVEFDGIKTDLVQAQEPAAVLLSGGEKPAGFDVCPVSGRKFWGNIDHSQRGLVATYGGPFDTYSIPYLDEDDELRVERYDQDRGDWVEGGEPYGWFYSEQQPESESPAAYAAGRAEGHMLGFDAATKAFRAPVQPVAVPDGDLPTDPVSCAGYLAGMAFGNCPADEIGHCVSIITAALPTPAAQGDAKDTERLRWLAETGARISWSMDGEYCAVWLPDERDGTESRPAEGYPLKCYDSWHRAIDAAIAAKAAS